MKTSNVVSASAPPKWIAREPPRRTPTATSHGSSLRRLTIYASRSTPSACWSAACREKSPAGGARPSWTACATSLQATINLLNALLDLSKLDAGAVEAHPGPVAMDDLLRRLFADYAGPAAAKGLDLRMVPSCGTLWTDDILLERILRNLVENALRYTPRGRVIVGGRRRGAALRIDVLDTGPGIPREQIGTIFNEFCQLENSERSRQSGHGLGLAIVRRTAELLHHPLEVRSVPGCGSRFSITVPLVATPGQACQPHECGFSCSTPFCAQLG